MPIHNAPLLIVRGLPGSGKSTYADQFFDRLHYETDMFFTDSEGNYKFDGSKIKKAHEWCQDSVREALKRGDHVVVSNTFTQLWEIQPYLDMAKELGVDVEIVEVNGNYGNTHGVSDEHVNKMRNRWEPVPQHFYKNSK